MTKEKAHKVIVNYLKKLCEKSITEENPFIITCLDGKVRIFCELISDISIPDNEKDALKQDLQKIIELPKINEFITQLIKEAIKKI